MQSGTAQHGGGSRTSTWFLRKNQEDHTHFFLIRMVFLPMLIVMQLVNYHWPQWVFLL